MEEIKTVYLIYLKSKNCLYAFTLEKKDLNSFLKERNKKVFHVEKRKMDQTALSLFMNKYYTLHLIDIPLFDGYEYITILGTAKEDNAVSDAADYLYNQFIYCENISKHFPFRKKYLKLIEDLTNVVTKIQVSNSEMIDPYLEIDTFRIFYHLFRDTFEEIADEEV